MLTAILLIALFVSAGRRILKHFGEIKTTLFYHRSPFPMDKMGFSCGFS
jgi:hypothetical protein